jgi:hypothetical protein
MMCPLMFTRAVIQLALKRNIKPDIARQGIRKPHMLFDMCATTVCMSSQPHTKLGAANALLQGLAAHVGTAAGGARIR